METTQEMKTLLSEEYRCTFIYIFVSVLFSPLNNFPRLALADSQSDCCPEAD